MAKRKLYVIEPDPVTGILGQPKIMNPVETPTRPLTPEENAIVEELYRRKNGTVDSIVDYGAGRDKELKGHLPTHAYVTLTREISKSDDAVSMGERIGKKQVFPAGTTLKIVMVSRFGDCGVTDNLDAESGYFTRFAFDDPTIVDIRWQPTPTKEWKEFLSGIIAKAAPNA